MKQVMTFVLLFLFGNAVNAQNYLRINITEIQDWQELEFCANEYDSVVIEKEPDCNMVGWLVTLNGQSYEYSTNEISLVPSQNDMSYWVRYYGNGTISSREFWVIFSTFQAPEPWTQDRLWIRPGEEVWLQAWGGYNYQWSNGSTDDHIVVTEDDTYWVRIYNNCGELWDTIQVCKSVEAQYATTDLDQNKYMVIWPVYAKQSEYVSDVDVYCDNSLVERVPYEQGLLVDEQNSVNTARTYTLMAIDNNGEECGIMSMPKKTMHMSKNSYGGDLNLHWNEPTGVEVIEYVIYELSLSGEWIYRDRTQETDYTCPESQFNYGYVFVHAALAGKDNEFSLVSNRSEDIVTGVNELGSSNFDVYPNPSNGTFVIEGPTTITICNLMGQVVATSYAENGVHTISINTPGVYFVKNDEGTTKRVVIELSIQSTQKLSVFWFAY